ncbi:MAG: flavodoxin domain-containing protein [Chloroflexi bacterium]|nr:flavodoxin domain-containing protein [Chloroflexota bacterium]
MTESPSPTTKRILVVYATRGGTTRDLAEQVAESLRANGSGVEILAAKKVRDITPYDAVVLGSAIYFRQLMPQAVRFLEQNASYLTTHPIAIFSVGAQMRKNVTKNHAVVDRWVRGSLKGVPQLQPVAIEHFAGAIQFKRLNLLWRLLVLITFSELGDWRNLKAVQDWANRIYPQLINRPNT